MLRGNGVAVRDLLQIIDAPREGSVVPSILSQLTGALGAMGAAYRPELTANGWGIETKEPSDHPLMRRLGDESTAFMRDAPNHFAHYDALAVQPDQQNQLLDPYRCVPGQELAPIMRKVHEPLGLTALQHMRVTVSDGPFLLMWLGVFRAEPFSTDEEDLLRAVIAPLQRRLTVERALWAGSPSPMSMLAEVLEVISSPAVVLDARKRIAFANEAGRAMLDRDRSLARACADAVDGKPSFRIKSATRLASAGVTSHSVVLLHDQAATVEARIAAVIRDCELTPAEAQVLAHVVRGEANKDIATRLRCAPRTIEVHMSSIFRKCAVETRARLIAWFWTHA